MCTATYVPLGPTGFALTHSRDEKALRPAAHPPREVRVGDHFITFPQDPQGQGTWIATNGYTTVCLLNGAFRPHRPQPPYRHSRGLISLCFFDYPSVDAFAAAYDFDRIEPFTLLVGEAGRLTELRWTGTERSLQAKDPRQPHIWSSVTLYSPEAMGKREQWFRTWLGQQVKPSVEAIRHFHKSAGDGDPQNDLRMNRRGELLTLSLTSVTHNGQLTTLLYEDLIQNSSSYQTLRLLYATA
ncbi:NRDE family protein [Fibrella sp. WM1]|uniref:NRDE family protein n=1 Tax=Fibrella musci TaxID=3242485 RepID=UPI00351FD743